MFDVKRVAKFLGLSLVLGTILYASVYFIAWHSDGFKFIEQRIKNSQEIKSQVGNIKQIRPSLLGPYHSKSIDSDEWVSITISVVGVERSIELEVKAMKVNDLWTLESVKHGEKIISLN